MIHKATLLVIAGLLLFFQLPAQKTITVDATSYDISDNLDLEAVAYLFGEAKNLEEFESMLNDPEKQISNLDLNEDGYVDYLRVIEYKVDGVYLVVIQAVLGEDLFQDVATIDVKVQRKNKVVVQIVGNEYIYGVNYILEPVYFHTPLIYSFFWNPFHTAWCSPYTWHHYPHHFYHRKPHWVHHYNVYVHEHYHQYRCRFVNERYYYHKNHHHQNYHRNDFAMKHPDKSFHHRNKEYENKHELTSRRSIRPNTVNKTDRDYAPQASGKLSESDTRTSRRQTVNDGNTGSGEKSSESRTNRITDSKPRRSVSSDTYELRRSSQDTERPSTRGTYSSRRAAPKVAETGAKSKTYSPEYRSRSRSSESGSGYSSGSRSKEKSVSISSSGSSSDSYRSNRSSGSKSYSSDQPRTRSSRTYSSGSSGESSSSVRTSTPTRSSRSSVQSKPAPRKSSYSVQSNSSSSKPSSSSSRVSSSSSSRSSSPSVSRSSSSRSSSPSVSKSSSSRSSSSAVKSSSSGSSSRSSASRSSVSKPKSSPSVSKSGSSRSSSRTESTRRR